MRADELKPGDRVRRIGYMTYRPPFIVAETKEDTGGPLREGSDVVMIYQNLGGHLVLVQNCRADTEVALAGY